MSSGQLEHELPRGTADASGGLNLYYPKGGERTTRGPGFDHRICPTEAEANLGYTTHAA